MKFIIAATNLHIPVDDNWSVAEQKQHALKSLIALDHYARRLDPQVIVTLDSAAYIKVSDSFAHTREKLDTLPKAFR